MICMVQAWRGVVERSLGLETSYLGMSPGLAFKDPSLTICKVGQ